MLKNPLAHEIMTHWRGTFLSPRTSCLSQRMPEMQRRRYSEACGLPSVRHCELERTVWHLQPLTKPVMLEILHQNDSSTPGLLGPCPGTSSHNSKANIIRWHKISYPTSPRNCSTRLLWTHVQIYRTVSHTQSKGWLKCFLLLHGIKLQSCLSATLVFKSCKRRNWLPLLVVVSPRRAGKTPREGECDLLVSHPNGWKRCPDILLKGVKHGGRKGRGGLPDKHKFTFTNNFFLKFNLAGCIVIPNHSGL